MHAATLLDAFSQLDDPRYPRGVRHPFAGMVVLMLLGMLRGFAKWKCWSVGRRSIGSGSASR